MNREVLPNGLIKLTAQNGVKDIRTNIIHSEVICKPENEHYFVEVNNAKKI